MLKLIGETGYQEIDWNIILRIGEDGQSIQDFSLDKAVTGIMRKIKDGAKPHKYPVS